MMKLRVLTGLLGLLLVLQVQAQQEPAQAPKETEKVAVQVLIDNLERGIVQLQTLSGQINEVSERDREALILRRDERSLKLLQALNNLILRTAEFPEGEPQREALEKRLRGDLADIGGQLFNRVQALDERIETHAIELESLSGTSRIAIQAYVQTLRSLRLRYYAALIDLIDGRNALGLASEELSKKLRRRLYLHAETLVGRVEFSGQAMKAMASRLTLDPQNAELQVASAAFRALHVQDMGSLQTIIGLLERLQLDAAFYKAVLVQQGQSLSIRDIESDVVMSLVGDAWDNLSKAASARAPDILFNIMVFVLILLVARILARLTKRAVRAACERPGVDISTLLKDVLVSVSGGTVTALGLLMALSQIGISLGPMLAGLGVAGFVVGFALQDTLGNFAAGGMILIYRPYDVDDFVEVVGASGLVKKMSLVSTTITTFDNQTLVIPNSKIWGDVIKNVTAQKVRRVDMVFGIGYSDDVELAERVLADIVNSNEKILKNPEALIKLHELADSSINFVVRPWTRTEDYWDVYWNVTREVKMRFDREGLSIPFPQRDVHLYQEPG